MTEENMFSLDGKTIPFQKGDTIMDAALRAGVNIPHLCHHPDFTPHGSCKLCTVNVNGRNCSACTFPASNNQVVLSNTEELAETRLALTQMLFVEGNHLCPSCEKSGNCQLQGVAYEMGMLDMHFPLFYPQRKMDASHPDIMLDRDRCIFCSLCVRASRDEDGKNVFAISGRGIHSELVVNAESGLLKDTDISAEDRAAHICPVGAIIIKRHGFEVPIGQRLFDHQTVSEWDLQQAVQSNAGEQP